MRADAQRLEQQLATPDTLARVSEPALPPTRTPAQAGYPIPFLSPAQQQRRAHERAQRQQQVLAAYNRAAQAAFLSPLLRQALSLGSSRISMLAKPQAAPGIQPAAGPTGSDCFMPPASGNRRTPPGAK